MAAAPGRSQVEAWYLLNLARDDGAEEAVARARQMTAAAPTDGWGWIALAGALNYLGGKSAEAVDAGAKALELMPDNPDAIWIRAQTLANDEKRREEAMAFVDAQRKRVKNPAEILNAKAYALYLIGSRATPQDEAKLTSAFDVYAEARQADPSNVNAHYLPGTYLAGMRRNAEAYPLLKRGVELAPGSVDTHRSYWTAVRAQSDLTPEQKNAAIESDLNTFVDKHGQRPGVLLAAARGAHDLKQLDRERMFEDTILSRFNDTIEAEWVLIGRIRQARESEGAVKNPAFRTMLREYIARPVHRQQALLGDAYRDLFFIVADDPASDPAELKRLVEGMATYDKVNTHITHGRGPIVLADRKIELAIAERLARDGIDLLKKRLEGMRGAFGSEKQFEDALRRAPATGHDALGWVLAAEGKMEEAEKELRAAHELSPENRDNLYHLGRFYQASGDVAKAEEYFVKGLNVQGLGKNQSADALRALYEKSHGSGEGYDKYLEGIRDRDRAARKEKILAGRLTMREAVAAFDLKTLDGRKVSLESLKGKTVVVNFWGIWCGWCVEEMPAFQKLHEKYANDPAVAILTINNDSNADSVPPWMKQKKYTFNVLLDDGYVTKVDVHAFPTTWFLDGDGRKIFEQVGWSEQLLEEFTWRIESMRRAADAGSWR